MTCQLLALFAPSRCLLPCFVYKISLALVRRRSDALPTLAPVSTTGTKDNKVNWKLREFKLYLFVNGTGDLFAMVYHGNVYNLVFHHHRLPKADSTSHINQGKQFSDVDDEKLTNIAGLV